MGYKFEKLNSHMLFRFAVKDKYKMGLKSRVGCSVESQTWPVKSEFWSLCIPQNTIASFLLFLLEFWPILEAQI